MRPDDGIPLMIRNHRPARWVSAAGRAILVIFAGAWGAALILDPRQMAGEVWFVSTWVLLLGGLVLGLFAPRPVWTIQVAEGLKPRPGQPTYPPADVVRIEFAPD